VLKRLRKNLAVAELHEEVQLRVPTLEGCVLGLQHLCRVFAKLRMPIVVPAP
jgi:hypothetical protein